MRKRSPAITTRAAHTRVMKDERKPVEWLVIAAKFRPNAQPAIIKIGAATWG